MEILITGGAGFIGSRLAELLAKKNEVIVLDNLDSYYDARTKKENLKIVECKGAKFIIGDVTDYDFIEKIIKENNIKIIFHETARPGVRYSIKDLFLPNKVNVIGTLNILKASLDSDVKSKYVDPVKGDARDTLANIDKAKKLIGYEPKTSLEEGLRKFIEWYKKNPSFYG